MNGDANYRAHTDDQLQAGIEEIRRFLAALKLLGRTDAPEYSAWNMTLMSREKELERRHDNC